MKKLLFALVVIIVLTAVRVPTVPVSAIAPEAATPTPTSVVAESSIEQGHLTFNDLGLSSDIVLRGPYDSSLVRFDLPPTWALQAGAALEMEITAYSNRTDIQGANGLQGAVLEVSMNDHLQKSIPLIFGDKQVYRVPLAPDSLISPLEDGGHKLTFFLNASVDCNYNLHDTTVTISVNSKAYFPHGQATLSYDLHRLPWPIFLQRGKIMDPVTVVLPASPSANELQAAFIVMGTFGRMTNGKVSLTSITANQLTDAILSQSHLLVIGKPSAFPMFSNLVFPVPLKEGAFSSPEMKPDDGIVQILPSPWNSKRAILMVSGNTDQAVVKASQALSTSNLQTGKSPNYSIIAQINPLPSAGVIDSSVSSSNDYKFSDLGYSVTNVTGIGSQWISYEFMIPAGQMPTDVVYLDLKISISALIDPKRSEGIVYLNGVQVGSVTLSSAGSNLITSRIYIPLSVIKSGLNQLDLVFNLLPLDACSLFTFTGMWATVYPDSVLHMPLTAAKVESSATALRDLRAYPSPFTNEPSLSTTTFVVTKQDKNSWLMAGKIAFDLGTRVNNPILNFGVAFDGQIPNELKANNLILVGIPQKLGIVSELKNVMPAYFDNGSNIAVMKSQQVIYRISSEKSLGYLELFTSPWNKQAAILGIFGTTPDGLGYATTSLLDSNIRSTLAGNFVTLEGSHALVVDTQTGRGLGRIDSTSGVSIVKEDNSNQIVGGVESTGPSSAPMTQGGNPNPTSPQLPSAAPAAYNSNKQMLLVGILSVAALIIVVAVAVITFKLRKKSG